MSSSSYKYLSPMEFAYTKKRGRPETGLNDYVEFKKFEQDKGSFQSGFGSKSKPCTQFFSTTGCPFGEGCHFSHHVPGGIKALNQVTDGNPALPPTIRNAGGAAAAPSSPWMDFNPTANQTASAGLGASTIAKISVDTALVRPISKQISQLTEVKLSIRDNESEPNEKIIELEGTFEQIKQAKKMVRELIVSIMSATSPVPSPKPVLVPPQNSFGAGRPDTGPFQSGFGSKSKKCTMFFSTTGCPFGEGCHFSHHVPGGIKALNQLTGSNPTLPPTIQNVVVPPTIAKISLDIALVGPISKQISQLTEVKLSIRDNESNPNEKIVELEGTFEQIKQAVKMVRELIVSIISAAGPPSPVPVPPQKSFGAGRPGTNLKTKLCKNFAKGSCTFGERCHFAHGASELRIVSV